MQRDDFNALMKVAERPPQVFVSGSGSWLVDESGTALSRFRPGLGGQLPRALPAGTDAGASRPGAAPHQLQPGVFQPAGGAPGATARGTQLLRSGVLLQQRRRGERGRDQARAQMGGQAARRRIRDRHLRRRVSRPYARHHVGFGQAAVGAAVRAQGQRLSQGAVRRSGRGRQPDRRAHCRSHARAGAGRGGGDSGDAGIHAGPARAHARERRAAHRRRDPDRHGAYRHAVRL